MTAGQVAELLHARRSGPNRWQAKCPAHDDRSPSLSIRETEDGRTLLHCFAGCGLDAILSASGLAMADLFSGPPPTPAQMKRIARKREAEELAAAQARRERFAKMNRLSKLETIRDSLGGKLMRHPEDSELSQLFHRVCHQCGEAYDAVYPNQKCERPAVNGPITEATERKCPQRA